MLDKTTPKPNTRLIKERAIEALKVSENDTKKAQAHLIAQAVTDFELRAELIRLGADQAVRNYWRDERRAAFGTGPGGSEEIRRLLPPSPPLSTEEQAQRETRQQQKIERRLFWDRYALFGQLPLRDACRPDLRDSMNKRRKQAAGNLACAAFEEDLAKRLRNDDTSVAKFFTDAKIIELAKVHHVI